MELFLIKHLLDQSIEEKRIYYFHGYGDSPDYCGYVLSYNNDTIQVKHYTRYGEDDGTINLPYEFIRTISIQSDYIQSTQYLIEYQENFEKMDSLPNCLLQPNTEGILSLLTECLNNRNIIVTIETRSESYIGFVDDIISSSYYIFTEIYSHGLQTETSIQKIEDIKNIRVNDKNGRKLLFLYNWRRMK